MLPGDSKGTSTRAALANIAAVIGLGLGMAACGDSSGSGLDSAPVETTAANTTADTGLPSCRDVNHTVVFSVFGAATTGADDEATTWMSDPEAGPTARPTAAAVASAYSDAGYEILYVTLLPAETLIGDQPVVDAITVWLGLNNFPVGEEVRVWAPNGDGAGDPSVALIEELTRMGASGIEIEAGYAGDQETVFPLGAGGISSDRVFLVGVADSAASSNRLSEDDLRAHLAEVQALDPICE